MRNPDALTIPIAIVIPDDVAFEDLHLERGSDGSLRFDWAVIRRICEASMVSESHFADESEDNVAALLVGWYQQHRAQGGVEDAIVEDLIHEVKQEDATNK